MATIVTDIMGFIFLFVYSLYLSLSLSLCCGLRLFITPLRIRDAYVT